MNIKKFITGITTMALVGTTMALSGVMTASADTYGHAWLMMQQGNPADDAGVSIWEVNDSNAVEINGNGSYTLSYDIPEGCGAEQIDFLGISADINIYEQNADEVAIFENMTFDITSIIVDGVEIAYNGPSANANGTNDDGSTYRLSIYDEWSSRNVQDIDNVVACASNITINFEVSGIVGGGENNGNANGGNVVENPEVTTVLVPGASNGNEVTVTTTTTDGTNVTTTTTNNTDVTTTGKDNGNTTTTTSSKKNNDKTSPSTGDAGLGVLAITLSVAGLSAWILRKKN